MWGAGDLNAAGREVHPCSGFTHVPLVACRFRSEPDVHARLPRLVDVDTRRGRYRGQMTDHTLRLATWAGIALAVSGGIAAAVGFSMDTTYPEEVPGWAFVLIWVGVGVAIAAAVVRGFLSGLKNQ